MSAYGVPVGVTQNGSGMRLTLLTATPVPVADVLAATSVYLTPYAGNQIGLYDGAIWASRTTAEVSLSIAGVASGSNYDVFAYWSGTAVVLELSAAWASDTARTDAVVRQDGVWVKSGTPTRRLVGTIRASAANQSEDSLARRFCWNADNQVKRSLSAYEATAAWTQATPNVWRQANAAAGNRVQLVRGANEQIVVARCQALMVGVTTQGTFQAIVGVGVDSTTVNAAEVLFGSQSNLTSDALHTHHHEAICHYSGFPGLGYHALNWLERNTATNGVSWTSAGTGLGSSGIQAETAM